MARTRLTDDDLLVALERLEGAAEQADDSDEQRATALGHYRGENLRPAPEGRSQVVDRTVWSVVEATKPQLLKLFLSGDEVVRFDPTGPEDIKAAEQESRTVNHVITQKNPAFGLFSGWIHDGLLFRNGYVKAFWDETDEIVRERYAGLSEEELALIVQDGQVEIVEQAEGMDLYGNPVFDVVCERKETVGQVRIVNVPPESVLIHANHAEVSLADCVFVQERTRKTISELREMGFDVPDDISDSESADMDFLEDYRREPVSQGYRPEGEEPDPSMREVLVRESWVRIDKEGKGTASLYHCIVVGKTLLLCEDADHIPIIAWCPIPQPHMHRGFSLHDETVQIQEVKTALVRSVLDNLWLSNNGRWAVDPGRMTNLDDFLVSRPGGIVRVEGNPSDAIMPLFTPFNPAPAMQMAEYMDVQRELTTGIPRIQQGQLDPLSQNKTATGISQVFAAGQQRIELIARYFGEGVKELCQIVHQLLSKHSRKPLVLMLDQEFVAVDPRQWAKRADLSVSVGLGSGNRFEQTQFLQQILALMFGPAGPMGLTDPSKVYNALAKLTTAVGYRNPEEFWINPATAKQPPPPPPPDPKLIEVQQRGQIEAARIQLDTQKAQADAQLAMQQAQIEQQRLELEKYRADLEAQVKLFIEQLKVGAAQDSQAKQIEAEDKRAQPAKEAAESEKVSNESMFAATQAIMQGLSMMQEQQQASLAAMQALVAAANTPKQVIRDANGRVIGVAPAQGQ